MPDIDFYNGKIGSTPRTEQLRSIGSAIGERNIDLIGILNNVPIRDDHAAWIHDGASADVLHHVSGIGYITPGLLNFDALAHALDGDIDDARHDFRDEIGEFRLGSGGERISEEGEANECRACQSSHSRFHAPLPRCMWTNTHAAIELPFGD